MKTIYKLAHLGRVSLLIAICFSLEAFTQETSRDRIIDKTPKAQPTASPTPAATPQTLSYLRARIGGVLADSMLRRGRIGLKIVSLDSGKVVIERNADKYFMPASNMKSFTVATAIDKLTPNFRFVTSIYANSKPDSNGTISGDLIVYGRGDPSISGNFYEGDDYKGIDALVAKIVASGVKRVDGNIIGDETYFNIKPIPIGWE
jgi:D-alanyl-D-alanine carboxypeptidase/D-alanyl-D-alanine-endopeptidase (penicillin-binding protein 4)